MAWEVKDCPDSKSFEEMALHPSSSQLRQSWYWALRQVSSFTLLIYHTKTYLPSLSSSANHYLLQVELSSKVWFTFFSSHLIGSLNFELAKSSADKCRFQHLNLHSCWCQYSHCQYLELALLVSWKQHLGGSYLGNQVNFLIRDLRRFWQVSQDAKEHPS